MQHQCEAGGPHVVGRLKTSLPFWRDNSKATQFVLDIVQNDYTIPLVGEPPPYNAPNNMSALSHPDFVIEAVEKLLAYALCKKLALHRIAAIHCRLLSTRNLGWFWILAGTLIAMFFINISS